MESFVAHIENQLKTLGITGSTLYHNLDHACLKQHELVAAVPERGVVTQSGAVAVDTGKYTGRSPKDKYVCLDPDNEHHVWWKNQGSDNQPISQQVWSELKSITVAQCDQKKLYVCDGFCGADPKYRLKVRLITEIAWMAHFFKNMFIEPSQEELFDFVPEWTIINACKTSAKDYERLGLNSSTYVAFNFKEHLTLIGGTWYGGEIKKGIFSVMNYLLPAKGIGSFHCSANQGKTGDGALFFGLSGTGKTTLSTDPNRDLIGDDEHAWSKDGIFNLEGGCYAKTIGLSKTDEPDIYAAIRENALLENVKISDEGIVDYDSDEKTQNTRVSYPIDHIDKIVQPRSMSGHPKVIIFLTCDAYGVLPPVSKLTKAQAIYHFISGYTAKIPGTELGVRNPTACFSACFGQPFLMRHPAEYAQILEHKITEHQSDVYLVNTGWIGGGYGVGQRISIPHTRAIINHILSHQIRQSDFDELEVFNLAYPRSLPNVPAHILNPKASWSDSEAYVLQRQLLAEKFINNFKKYASHPYLRQYQDTMSFLTTERF